MRAEQEFDWTDDAIAELHRLHATGASYSAIGDALGISRNAAIGKARRVGLTGQRLSAEVVEAKRRKRASNKDAQRRRAMTNIEQLALPPRPVPMPPECLGAPLEQSKPCTLLDLKPHVCRWPLWSGDDDARLFCGAVTLAEHSYCAAHKAIATARPYQRQETVAAQA